MQETNTIRFFRELSSRMNNENDLSDIVHALCESNLQFKQFFLDFFFRDQHLKADQINLQREVQFEDGSRPDFVLRNSTSLFFVEVKIWNGTHHFAQYAKTLKSNGSELKNLAYIANYDIVPNYLSKEDKDVYLSVKSRVKTWSEFVRELERKGQDPLERSWATGEDVQGFIEYCRRVCPFYDSENVDSFTFYKSAFLSVKHFYKNIEEALVEPIPLAGKMVAVGKYSRGKYNSPGDWFGMYFSVSNLLQDDETIWGWIGCYLQEKSPQGLCIEFLNKNGWGAPVFRWLDSAEFQLDYCFDVKDLSVNGFGKESIREKMKEAFKSVIDKVPPKTSDKIKTLAPIRSMRRFALFLEQNIIKGLFDNEDNVNLEIVQHPDSQDPSGWCGVYFAVDTKDKEHESHETSRKQGWLGVYFDNRERLGDGMPEDGSRIVLEWSGLTKLIAVPRDGVELDPDDIKEKVRKLLKELNYSSLNPT